jgi:hypothetical protein
MPMELVPYGDADYWLTEAARVTQAPGSASPGRADHDGRWGAVHAFPGVTNAASNALCRNHGFSLVGEDTFDYRGRRLRYNHWIREEPR